MSPITVNDWSSVQEKLGAILVTQERLQGQINALKNQQEFQHIDNQERIGAIKSEDDKLDVLINGNENSPWLRTDMASLIAYGKASSLL
jgi:hypothetical protein